MKQVALLILDGWGWSKEKAGNAIFEAKTPNMDFLKKNYPFFLIQASGLAVGLPPLKEGNSEVGHLTIGAGRIIFQHLTVIDESIKNGSFFKNETFARLMSHVEKNGSKLHLLGLLTSGTVHASLEHLLSLIKHLRREGAPGPVLLHLFTDGKDSGKKESLNLLEKLEKEIAVNPGSGQKAKIKIATLIGRDFAMDRDNNWELTQKAYGLLTWGLGEKVENLKESVAAEHLRGKVDEIIPPLVKDEMETIEDGDGVLFFNFREDSARQLTRAFTDDDFNFFKAKRFKNLFFATMTDYGRGLKAKPIFKREKIKNTLAEVLDRQNIKQLHIAETAKYAHVTYFLNGLREEKFKNETDLLIPSNGDILQNPKMKTEEIAKSVVEELEKPDFKFVVVNFANPDMLSHTGDYQATIQGIRAVDEAIGEIYEAAQKKEAVILITGDHGNAENLIYSGTGEKESRHNSNPVPFLAVGKKFKKEKDGQELASEETEIKGMLQDVAPTVLKLLEVEKPAEMTGINLL
ncbi:MAG: 2,3-bisphosphoglycerate-independent phosphoglycerate mutase [Parcubacteria group bacterium]|nr:2,3-bisphosphoglycerate-independent phosphoglycerate mutase [Parcubacteria group bacterium]